MYVYNVNNMKMSIFDTMGKCEKIGLVISNLLVRKQSVA